MLQATMIFDGTMKQYFLYNETESNFWENVGKHLLNIPIPRKKTWHIHGKRRGEAVHVRHCQELY